MILATQVLSFFGPSSECLPLNFQSGSQRVKEPRILRRALKHGHLDSVQVMLFFAAAPLKLVWVALAQEACFHHPLNDRQYENSLTSLSTG